MEIDIITAIVGLLLVSVTVLLISHRLRIPSIVGFLLIGVVSGPSGLGIVRDSQIVGLFAEAGVILLLFTIGLEFSFENLFKAKRTVLLGGSLHVITTITAVFTLALIGGLPPGESVFLGFLISLSSTAIVMKTFQDQGELESLPGRTALGILIFQDMMVLPMLLVIPYLGGLPATALDVVVNLVFRGVLIFAFIFISARWLVPKVLYTVARERSRELFLFTVVVICLSIAWLTASAGLTLAMGAFFAGLIIGESEFRIEALSNITPFRDVAMFLFFISIGMLLDITQVISTPGAILVIVGAIISLKILIGTFATMVLGLPSRVMILVGLALCQIGEFSFILAKAGLDFGVIDVPTYQLFLASAIITMAATPFFIRIAPRVAEAMQERLQTPKRFIRAHEELTPERRTDHLVIVGFGLTGRSVARAADIAGIPYTVIESNPETVRKERRKKIDILFGDATNREVLEYAGIREARVIVIAISDQSYVGRIIRIARLMNPSLYIVARARYMAEVSPLIDLGADEVISEEYEASLEIFTRVLSQYFIPHGEIGQLMDELRGSGYEMLRKPRMPEPMLQEQRVTLPDIAIQTIRVEPGSTAAGRTRADLNLRKQYRVTVLAVRRDQATIPNPPADFTFREEDLIIALAAKGAMDRAASLFRSETEIRDL